MSSQQISQKQLRSVSMLRQGILRKQLFGKGKKAVLAAIERLGYVQIDTISVVERAHHHVLFSRVPDYTPTILDELIEKDKTVFEYWSHAAAYLPMRDYRFSLLRKQAFAGGSTKWFEEDIKMQEYILDKIRMEGSVQAKDFEHKRKEKSGWWEWKPAKKALEHLFMRGELMVAKREGFRKIYDLPERVLPNGVNTAMPSLEEYTEHLTNTTIDALGAVSIDDIAHLRSSNVKNAVRKKIESLIEEKKIISVICKETDGIYYTTEEILNEATAIRKKSVSILSPFDNSVIRRKRLMQLFGFDYTIECYVPEPKRKYGYFCLPIVYGTDFIARIDCKAERKKKILTVINLFPENGYSQSECREIIKDELHDFATWNGCDAVEWK